MTASDVKIGNYYSFAFLGNWSSFDGAYKITGYASPDIVTSINDGKSIFTIFFEELGYDIDLYNSYIEDSTLVYVATKLVTTDPIEESIKDTESIVYIPSTLIKFSESYEYMKANRLTYSFSTEPRLFKNDKALNDYKTSAKNLIKEAINKISEFSVDKISIDVSDNEVLSTQSEYDTFVAAKEEKDKATRMSELQWRANQESAERQLYSSTLEAENAKANYLSRYESLATKIDEANKIVQNNKDQRNYLNKIKEYIVEVIGDIMVRQPTAFDGINGLPTNYSASQVYQAIYNIVSNSQ